MHTCPSSQSERESLPVRSYQRWNEGAQRSCLLLFPLAEQGHLPLLGCCTSDRIMYAFESKWTGDLT